MIKLKSLLKNYKRDQSLLKEDAADSVYFYHATLADHLPSIYKEGLLPSENTHWGGALGNASLGKVFVTDSFKTANFYGNILWRNGKEDRFKPILRFKYPKSKLTKDKNSARDYYSSTTIKVPFDIFVYNQDTKIQMEKNGDVWFDQNTGYWRSLSNETSKSIYYGEWDEMVGKISERILQMSPPKYLFHATFNALVPSISSRGLIPGGVDCKNFEGCENGVYLSNDEGFAGSMIQSTENEEIPVEWLEEIVIITIDVSQLDLSKIEKDPHVHSSDEGEEIPESFIYKGTIPPTAIVSIDDFEG
jgi:hypothetical protein